MVTSVLPWALTGQQVFRLDYTLSVSQHPLIQNNVINTFAFAIESQRKFNLQHKCDILEGTEKN